MKVNVQYAVDLADTALLERVLSSCVERVSDIVK